MIFFKIIAVILAITAILFMAYYCAIFLIKMYFLCTSDEAMEIIASKLNHNKYDLGNDINFIDEVNETIKDIIGQDRYEKIVRLAKHSGALINVYDKHSGVPFVMVTMSIEDHERIMAATLLENVVARYSYFYGTNIKYTPFSKWCMSEALNLPQLKIFYARNRREKDMLDHMIEHDDESIKNSSKKLYDEEEVNLFD